MLVQEDKLYQCGVCGSFNVRLTKISEENIRVKCIRCSETIRRLQSELDDSEKSLEHVEQLLIKAHGREYDLLQEMKGGVKR